MKAQSPILAALNSESYQWLSVSAPDLLEAVEQEVAAGKTPAQIARLVSIHVGPDRQALAVRVRQAAEHCARIAAGRG